MFSERQLRLHVEPHESIAGHIFAVKASLYCMEAFDQYVPVNIRISASQNA